jgi:hypothetical protein
VKLRLERYSSGPKSTLGLLFINEQFQCYTCEDRYRAEKVAGETRIAPGTYDIKLRTVGGFHKRYRRRYGTMHKGMLWLRDVPQFEYILIHVGNSSKDSAGCILVGRDVCSDPRGGGSVVYSRLAYKDLYPKVADALIVGEKVTIEIIDRDN